MQQMMAIARSPPGDLASVEVFQECPRDDRLGPAESGNLSALNMPTVVNLTNLQRQYPGIIGLVDHFLKIKKMRLKGEQSLLKTSCFSHIILMQMDYNLLQNNGAMVVLCLFPPLP